MEVQQGIWIDEQWLKSAGLGSRLQVIVQSGEIRIAAAPANNVSPISSATAWSIFRSLGKNAKAGKLHNASVEHDRYLYGKGK
ncbi:hypothetical protein L0244_31050 [bacterium]|nr:hypothetical protein [bacterium]